MLIGNLKITVVFIKIFKVQTIKKTLTHLNPTCKKQ